MSYSDFSSITGTGSNCVRLSSAAQPEQDAGASPPRQPSEETIIKRSGFGSFPPPLFFLILAAATKFPFLRDSLEDKAFE